MELMYPAGSIRNAHRFEPGVVRICDSVELGNDPVPLVSGKGLYPALQVTER